MNTSSPIIVIPMCGVGSRFKSNGYIKHKSLLKIHNETMLERIINKFPNDLDTYIITTQLIIEELNKYPDWHRIKGRFKLIIIEDHKKGPAYSIFKGLGSLPKKTPCFICYCDITWSWDYDKIPIKEDTKASIFCHTGFHPHLVNNNYSAFCLPNKNNNLHLKEIREKESFTSKWMDELLSIGLFYIDKLERFKNPLKDMIRSNLTVSNEYFPSLLYNYLLKDNIPVNLIKVDSFVHYGTPEAYSDINNWCKVYSLEKQSKINDLRHKTYPGLILASGSGSRMKAISIERKASIKVFDKSLIELVKDHLPLDLNAITVSQNSNESDLDCLPSNTKYIRLPKTSSQLESLYMLTDYIKELNNFFVCSCDCYGFMNNLSFDNITSKGDKDIVCFGFQPSLLQNKLGGGYSTFSYESDCINNIYVKEIPKQSQYLGLGGFFWIKDGNMFSKYISSMLEIHTSIDRELIADDVVKCALQDGAKIGFIELDHYIHLGSSHEYSEYKYWLTKINKLIF